MRGLLTKIFVEVRWPVLLFGLGMSLIMGLLTMLLPKVLGDIHRLFERMSFIKPLITALLGVDPGERMTAGMSQAFLWVHPTVLTLMWVHEVMFCTRVPAGEVDRGTIDFLLSLPVSRWKVFMAETIGWLCSGLFILVSGFSGHLLASVFVRPEMRPAMLTTFYVMTNLFAVYLAVGGFAFLISACSDRRGRATGVVFAVLLASFLLNFLAQFWDPFTATTPTSSVFPGIPGSADALPEAAVNPLPGFMRDGLADTASSSGQISVPQKTGFSLATISVMDYYRPAIIIQSGKFPAADVGLLLAIAVVTWTLAGIIFRRRSICTV